jgi:hypothetical protein
MARRTQITITDEQHARLQTLSEETGLSMSELVRQALDRAYAGRGSEALEVSFGSWKGRRFNGEGYVERLRGGLGQRLRKLGGGAR